MPKKKKEVERKPLLNFRSNMCTNPELSDKFADEVLRITGLEVDDEGYIVDTEEDPFEPDYIFVKGKMLRRTNQGLLFAKDIIFDPYNNTVIIEELLRQYIQKYHPEISTYNIFVTEKNIEGKGKYDLGGYMRILYKNGAQINTNYHIKDSTKFLEGFMRLESMSDELVNDLLKPFDEYEKEQYRIDLEKLNSKKK